MIPDEHLTDNSLKLFYHLRGEKWHHENAGKNRVELMFTDTGCGAARRRTAPQRNATRRILRLRERNFTVTLNLKVSLHALTAEIFVGCDNNLKRTVHNSITSACNNEKYNSV